MKFEIFSRGEKINWALRHLRYVFHMRYINGRALRWRFLQVHSELIERARARNESWRTAVLIKEIAAWDSTTRSIWDILYVHSLFLMRLVVSTARQYGSHRYCALCRTRSGTGNSILIPPGFEEEREREEKERGEEGGERGKEGMDARAAARRG